MALGIAIGLPISSAPAAGGDAEPYERIADTGFDTGTGWSGAAWTVGSGVAVNATAGQFLVGTLTAPIVADDNVVVLVGVTANPNTVTFMLTLYNTSTLASQAVISDSSGFPGLIPGSVIANGTYDAIRIRAIADPGLTLDSVSVLA